MNKNRGKTPPLVRFGVFLAVTIGIWIVFETYREFAIKPIEPVPASVLLPLDPNLDAVALNEIQSRISLGEGEIGDTTITVSPQSVPEPEELETEVTENEVVNVATNEGEINE